MMSFPYLELRCHDLRFIGEGNENVVFSLRATGCVLRIKKTPIDNAIISKVEFWKNLEKDLNFINFSRHLVSPLLVNKAYPVTVDPTVINDVLNCAGRLREGKRLKKAGNPFGVGILFINATVSFTNRKLSERISGTCRSSPLTEFKHFSTYIKNYDNDFLVRLLPSQKKIVNQDYLSNGTSRKNLRQSEHFAESQREPKIQKFVDGVRLENKVSPNKQPKSFRMGFAFHPASPISLEEKVFLITQEETFAFRSSVNQENIGLGNNKVKRICIELKPKQGYKELAPSGIKICRFCLKQFIKLQKGSESSRSLYCPLDLFSGNRKQMKKALKDLFSTPQNNLRIFVEGVAVKKISKFSHFDDLIIDALLYDLFKGKKSIKFPIIQNSLIKYQESKSPPFKENTSYFSPPKKGFQISSPCPSDVIKGRLHDQHEIFTDIKDTRIYERLFKDNKATLLAPSSILGRVLLLQSFSKLYECEAAILMERLQTESGTENISDSILANIDNMFTGIFDSNFDESETKTRPKASESEYAVQGGSKIDWLKKTPQKGPSKLPSKEVVDKFFNGSFSDVVQSLQESLLTLSVKDVSLMILFQGPYDKAAESALESPFWLPFRDKWYMCQVTVVDLALKCPSKLLEHKKSFAQMEQILSELQTKPSCCSDAE